MLVTVVTFSKQMKLMCLFNQAFHGAVPTETNAKNHSKDYDYPIDNFVCTISWPRVKIVHRGRGEPPKWVRFSSCVVVVDLIFESEIAAAAV